MKNIILLFFLSSFIIACSENKTEKRSLENDLQKEEVSEEMEEELPDEESSPEEISVEEEEEQMEAEMILERTKHKKRMLNKDFRFQCINNCETGGGTDASIEVIKKYKRREAFDIKQEFKTNSYIIKFKFVDECCLENVGDISYVSDTLKVEYRNISSTPCECYCEYEYEFRVQLKNAKPKYIKLNGKLLDTL